jgi:hypothetical protein
LRNQGIPIEPEPGDRLVFRRKNTCIAFGSANIIQLIHYNEDVLNGAIHPGQAPPKLARPVRSAATGLAPDRAEQEVDTEGYTGVFDVSLRWPRIPRLSLFSLRRRTGSTKTFHVSQVLSFLFHRGEYR